MPKKGLLIWEQQYGETAAPFAAFVAYRDMARPRNQTTLAKTLGYAESTIHTWASENAWEDRVVLYDQHLDRKRVRAAERANEKAGERLARKALVASERMLDAAMVGARNLRKDAESGLLTAQQVARLTRDGTQMSRLVLGEATERVETTEDLSRLTDEELAIRAALNRKAAGLPQV